MSNDSPLGPYLGTGFAGDTTVVAGGVAQYLYGGRILSNGFAVYNPDATHDLWVSSTQVAAPNGLGSIRVAANGGGYETPPGYHPAGPLSVYGYVTGQNVTSVGW